MSEPLNPERDHLDKLIAEEKLLWKSKVEDGLSWEQTTTVFEEKFHRHLSLSTLEQRFNRLKVKSTDGRGRSYALCFFVLTIEYWQSQKKPQG